MKILTLHFVQWQRLFAKHNTFHFSNSSIAFTPGDGDIWDVADTLWSVHA